jgi:hypothetical protein
MYVNMQLKFNDNDKNSDAQLRLGADNVIHNIGTIDGQGTFHGMGIFAALTPDHIHKGPILRPKSSSSNFKTISRVSVAIYRFAKSIQNGLKFRIATDGDE